MEKPRFCGACGLLFLVLGYCFAFAERFRSVSDPALSIACGRRRFGMFFCLARPVFFGRSFFSLLLALPKPRFYRLAITPCSFIKSEFYWLGPFSSPSLERFSSGKGFSGGIRAGRRPGL
jgi:hypothetical protein